MAAPSKTATQARQVDEELDRHKAQQQSLEKKIAGLERDKAELDLVTKEERGQLDRTLVNLLRDKFARDESIRHDLEGRLGEMETELDRMAKRIETEVQMRDEALRNADAMRAEVKSLEERVVQDEQLLTKARELERQLRMEVDEYHQRVAEDEQIILSLRDAERALTSSLDQSQARAAQLEADCDQDGRTIVEMRDAERALRAELDQVVGRMKLLDEQARNDEGALAGCRETIKGLQSENEGLHNQCLALEERVMHDDNELGALREADRQNKAKLRMLEDISDEVQRLKEELDESRRSGGQEPATVVTTTTRTRRRSRSPPRSPTRGSSLRSPVDRSMPGGSMMEERTETHRVMMDDATRGVPNSPFADLSVRLDSLQQKLRGQLSTSPGTTSEYYMRRASSPTGRFTSPRGGAGGGTSTRSPRGTLNSPYSRISTSTSTTSIRRDPRYA